MTSFVTRDASHLGVDRIATSPTAYALYQNVIAAFEKDSTAVSAGVVLANDYIVTAMIAAAQVSQSRLKTTTASGSVSVAVDTSSTYSLAGGTYSWWTAAGAITGPNGVFAFGNGDQAAGVLGIHRIGGDVARSFNIDERYVQASPPYDLGDGEIPLFVWALIENATKDLLGMQIAGDPPWAYHGPTDITPEFFDKAGKGYRRIAMIEGKTMAEVAKDKALFAAYVSGLKRVELVEAEITSAYKNSDVAVWPHPFVGNDLTGKTVVLLDPVGALAERLYYVAQSGGASEVRELLRKKWVDFDNVDLPRNAPPGVKIVSASLK